MAKFIILLSLLNLFQSCSSDYQQIEIEINGHQRDNALFSFPKSLQSENRKLPLFVLLHGYAAERRTFELQFGLQKSLKAKGYAFVAVNGVRDSAGKRFWNASQACCNRDAKPQNDLDYLLKLITKITANYKIDPDQVFLVGYSNGGFMSYRLACERADLVKGILSFAGTAGEEYESCAPSKPVRILHVHGTEDDVIKLNGGSFMNFAPHISAAKLTQLWAKWNRCEEQPTISKTADVTYMRNNNDNVTHFVWNKCQQNSFVELQTHQGDGHMFFFESGVIDALIEKLVKNPTAQSP